MSDSDSGNSTSGDAIRAKNKKPKTTHRNQVMYPIMNKATTYYITLLYPLFYYYTHLLYTFRNSKMNGPTFHNLKVG